MEPVNITPTASAPAPETAGNPLPRIRIISVGGAGLEMLRGLNSAEFPRASMAAVVTRATQLQGESCEALLLDHSRLRGIGTGGDPERARKLAEENLDKLKALVLGYEVVILIAGFGGGSGTGITPILAQAAKDAGALVLVFATLPFTCECRRVQVARHGIYQAREAADAVVCLPNEKLLELLDPSTPCEDAFAAARGMVAEGVRGFYQWLVYRGPMEIPFAEVCRLLRNQHSEAIFATASSAGAGRVNSAVEQLLATPLLGHGRLLDNAKLVVISLFAGPDLSIAEISQVVRQLGARCERAEVVAGTALDESMRGRLGVTLLVASGEPVHSAPAPDACAIPQDRASRGMSVPEQSPEPRGERPRPPTATEHSAQDSGMLPPLAEGGRSPIDLSNCPGEQPASMLARSRKAAAKLRQAQLALPLVSRGQRFENSEPTMHKGEDLDVPTYIRRGIVLN